MLTNKKFVRLAALVMALLMTVAVFAGCSNKKVDAMQEQLDAADQAAKDAQKAAEEAAKKAEEQNKALQDLLDDLKNKLEEGFKNTEDGIKDVENKVDGYHPNGAETTAPSIGKDEFEGITDTVLKEQKLKSYTELTTLYTVDRADWYTADNYAKLVKIFEEAAYELYRSTTIDGIDQIIAEASAAAAAVDSIVSDAAKVQALIDAFGDVETEIFTTNEDKVFAAREAFDKWVNDYATRFFVKNAYGFIYNKGVIVTAGQMIAASKSISGKEVPVAKDIVDFARKLTGNLVYININDNTNSLLFAEKKIESLHAWALQAIKNEMAVELIIAGKTDAGTWENPAAGSAQAIVIDLFKSVDKKEITATEMKAVVDTYKAVLANINRYGVNYDECKANAALIEAAYTEYRVFWNANGGDDAPIAGAPAEKLLTGTEFVKRYVQTLYDGQLREYQNTVNTYLSENVINFFMNNGGAVATIPTAWVNNLVYFGTPVEGYANDGTAIIADATAPFTFVVKSDKIEFAGTSVKADGVAIEHAFNVVAAKAYASIFDLVYSEDFKGNKSLKEAYVAIDQIVVKAVVEMTQVYYDQVIAPVLVETLTKYEETLEAKYGKDVRTIASKDYYNAKDKAFYNNMTKLVADAKAAVKAVKVPTYEELNAIANAEKKIKNIEDQAMFNVLGTDVFAGVEVNTDAKNSAMKTVLEYFAADMKVAAKEYFTKMDLMAEATWFYDLKVTYALAAEDIFGMNAKFNDDDALTEGTTGFLGTDFYATAQTIMGKNDSNKYNLTKAAIFKAVNTPAKALRDAIMALEYVDYTNATAKYAFEKYQAQDDTNKHKNLFYKVADDKAVTDSKDAKALEIIVDREVVAANALINTFADGANKALKAFADLVRAEIKAGIAGGVELYKTNYSFGNLDLNGVYLEKDMNEYLAYLDSLTNLEAVSSFKVVKFTKASEYVAKNTVVSTMYGEAQKVKDADGKTIAILPHIALADVTVAAANVAGATETDGAWYNKLGKGLMAAYLAMDDANKVYNGLEAVRELAYEKDDYVNVLMPAILAKYVGTVNKDTGALENFATGFEYVPGTDRSELYLTRLNETYAGIIAAIEAVSLLTDDGEQTLAAAKAELAAYKTGAEAAVAYTIADDYSLVATYARYYKVGAYNWASYNAWMAENN